MPSEQGQTAFFLLENKDMLGAVIGDMVGAPFELNHHKSTDFPLFSAASDFTDDTVCTVAVADWVGQGCAGNLADILQSWCRRYPRLKGAYGQRFEKWIWQNPPQPYGSWGNGAAMRVSAVAWAFSGLSETLHYAKQSAMVTHNHPEGIKGAQAVAAAVYWARTGWSKDFIRRQMQRQFAYDMSRSCDEIRPHYRFDASCQGSVPEAVTAFLDSENFEHALRLAVSLGGDSDTLAAIAGSIAEAYYREIPAFIVEQALSRLPDEMAEVLLRITPEMC